MEGLDSTAGQRPVLFKSHTGLFRWNKKKVKIVRNLILLLTYLCYYGYAMYCEFGNEESIRLTVFTGFGLAYITWNKALMYERPMKGWNSFLSTVQSLYSHGNRPKVIQWFLYIAWSLLFVTYVIINVAIQEPGRLRPLGGYVAFLVLLLLVSNNRRKINWHCVFWGSALQSLLGYFILKSDAGTTIILWFSDRLVEFLDYSKVGSEFIFGAAYTDHPIAMEALPSVIVFCAGIQVLVYLGTIQFIVRTMGTFIAFVLDVSAPEATNAVANIFLGGTEAVVLLSEYMETIPTSRLFALMTNAAASCSGVALIQFMAFGVPAKYLLAASAMSAPAALVCAKLTYPDTDQNDMRSDTGEISLHVLTKGEKSTTLAETDSYNKNNGVSISVVQPNVESKDKTRVTEEKPHESHVANDRNDSLMPKEAKSIGEALLIGTRLGMKLVTAVVGLAFVALAFIEFANKTVEWFGDRVHVHIDLYIILSYAFYPCVYMMGVDTEDCLRAGRLLGIRTMASPFIAYVDLGEIIDNRQRLDTYIDSFNETLVYNRDSDIYLPRLNQTLTGGVFSERSELVMTYALCGFASLPSIGMTVGALVAIIPRRAPEVTSLAMRSFVAGTVASYLTACVAGLLS